MNDAAILIVTHNSAGYIGECLDRAKDAAPTIVVIDNASTDNTVDLARSRGVIVQANIDNRSFAYAVNQGVRLISNELILLLNPDAMLQTRIDALCEACRRSGVGAAGGRLVDSNQRDQIGFTVRRFPTPAALAFEALLLNRLWKRNPVNWHYRCYDLSLDQPNHVEQPAGALLLFRREAWQQAGGFDEAFAPLWFEDVDFCRRIHDLGWRLEYVPEVVARHEGGHSLQSVTFEARQVYWYANLLRYATKHFSRFSRRMVALAILLGSIPRLVMGIASRGVRGPVVAWWGVVRLAGRSLLPGHARPS